MAEVSYELLEAKVEAINARINAMDQAIELARRELEGRLVHLNELRREVMDDRRTFVTAEVFEAKMARLDAWKNSLWLSVLSVVISLSSFVILLIRLAN